jgi:hypothetical protein
MLFNHLLGIYCHWCRKYYDPYTEVYLNLDCEGSISCQKGHNLGYEWDLTWEEFFRQDEI